MDSAATNDDGANESPASAGWVQKLFQPIDIASLVSFRLIFFGSMLFEHVRYWAEGWLKSYYIDNPIHFKFYGFAWVERFDSPFVMQVIFAVTALAALMGLIGAFYRVSASVLFVGFTYLFLLDAATYRNHFYLLAMIALMMCFLPAHRAFSIDAWRNSKIRSNVTPFWTIGLIRFQLIVVYFFAGIAKLDPDWLSARVIRGIFAAEDHTPAQHAWLQQDHVAYFVAWSGLAFDLTVGFALLWRRTRPLAFLAAAGFHLTNALVFVSVGIFPWFTLLASTIFFSPSWPRRAWAKLTSSPAVIPPIEPSPARPLGTGQKVVVAVLIVHALIQIALPLRHHLYEGRTSWTHNGHRWAWRMKLVHKEVITIRVTFEVPGTGERHDIDLLRAGLRPWQIGVMARQPDLLLQFVHRCKEVNLQGKDYPIRVYSLLRLNRHKPQLLVDPDRDLTQETNTLGSKDWVLPFVPDR